MNKLKLHTRHDSEILSVSRMSAYCKNVTTPTIVHIRPLNVPRYEDGELRGHMITILSNKNEAKLYETLTMLI